MALAKKCDREINNSYYERNDLYETVQKTQTEYKGLFS